MSKLSHEERTAGDPRESDIHHVSLYSVEQANASVRLIRLRKRDPHDHIRFLPGQWLDLFLPGFSKAGGFTITSTPDDERDAEGHIELAIKKSPDNPAAAWLWQKEETIIGQSMFLRVGGNFVWPPPGIDPTTLESVILVAGGVGINPLASILSYWSQTRSFPPSIHLLYSNRGASESRESILFYTRLRNIFSALDVSSNKLSLFHTLSEEPLAPALADVPKSDPGTSFSTDCGTLRPGAPFLDFGPVENLPIDKNRRMKEDDLLNALGPVEKRNQLVAYVCGPPSMTDWAVDKLRMATGMKAGNVLCEKWW